MQPRDTTDPLVMAREMQRAGAGIRSLAEPYLDTTFDFAEIVFVILGVAAKLERRRILERARPCRCQGQRRQISAANRFSPRISNKRPASASKRASRSAALPAVTMLGASGPSPTKTLSMFKRRARARGRRLAWQD